MTPDFVIDALAVALSAALTEFGWPTTLTDYQCNEAYHALRDWRLESKDAS